MNPTDQQKKRDHALTIYIDDPSIKELFTAAARRDNRKKSDWFRTHIMPAAINLAKEQLAKPAVPGLLPLIPQPRHVTMFERLRHEAESALRSEPTG
jgi:hypothetical protein